MMREYSPNTNDYEPNIYQDDSYTEDEQTDPLMGELNDTPAEIFQFKGDEAEARYGEELEHVLDEDHRDDQTGERDAA